MDSDNREEICRRLDHTQDAVAQLRDPTRIGTLRVRLARRFPQSARAIDWPRRCDSSPVGLGAWSLDFCSEAGGRARSPNN